MASVSKRTRNGKVTWLARWREPDGTKRKRSFVRKVDAERFLTTVRHGLLTGAYIDPAGGRRLFRDYADAWRLGQPHRPSTAKAVEQHLRCYAYGDLGARPIASIRPSEMQAWATGLSKRLAPSTCRTVVSTVKAVFRAAVHDRLIAATPCHGLVLPKVPPRRVEPLTIEQVRGLIQAAPEQYQALFMLGVGSGLRPGELFGLQVRHVDFLRRTVTVDQQVQQSAGQGVYAGHHPRPNRRTGPCRFRNRWSMP